MSTNEMARQFSWRDTWAMLLVLLGLVLIALSVVWPSVSTGRAGWTDEEALAYQSASAEMHRLSMQAAKMEPEEQTRAFQNELADAESKYGELRAELEAARSRPVRTATVLRYLGVALLVGGVLGLAANRGNGSTNR